MILNKRKIRRIMKKEGLNTQTELAEKMKISKNQLSVMLSNKFDPIKSNVRLLCDILNINVVDVLEEEQEIDDMRQIELDLDTYIDTSKVTPNKNYTVVELFAGAGGLALGLEHAGFVDVGLVEIDKNACNTLRHNRSNWNVIEEDIINISEKGILDFIKPHTEIDLLSGGYPCQSFSYAGHKKGLEDVRGTMFFYYAKILEELMPKVFLAENVRGLLSHDKGKTLKTMIGVFEEIGYNVQFKVLNAWDYGVAQKRKRIAIVGVRNDIDAGYRFPKEYEYKPVLRDALKDVPKSNGSSYPDKKKKVMELVPPGGYWRDLPEEIAKNYMGVSYYSSGGRTGMARRISWNEPSLTLTCSPSQKQTERCHPDETRPFTIREYARIQSFPDDWHFTGSLSQQYKQIGNAVPVEMARAIGLSIIDLLNRASEH